MHKILYLHLNLFNFLLLHCVPIVVKSEDVSVFFDVQPSNDSILCNANTSSVKVQDGDDVKFHFNNAHYNVCRVSCNVQTKNQDHLSVSLNLTDNVKVTSNLDGLWHCSVFVSKGQANGNDNNNESSPIPVECIIHMNVEKSQKEDLMQKPQVAISDNFTWIYAGCSIGAIVLIVITTQTILVCYLKRKAKIAIQRSRHENLSAKTYSELSDPEKARYSATPGSKSKSKNNLDEQTLYESVEDLTSVQDAALIEYQKRIPIELRPKMPLPTNEEYEDMDVTDGAANSKGGQIKTIAPSFSSLPRPPRRLPPHPPLQDNTNQKKLVSVIFELDNILKKKLNAGSKPLNTIKRPKPAPKPDILKHKLQTSTTNIPVNVVNNDDQSNDFNSSDEEWTYEPLKDINFSIYNNV